MRHFITLLPLLILSCFTVFGQRPASQEGNIDNLPVREYNLTIDYKIVDKTGKKVQAMTINGGIPGPTLEFTEGEYAVINVTNQMEEETSVHWHGLLLPNFYDGVPYLTTPPIESGGTQRYEFALTHSGTYWYHSHTGLQEQRGVYGAIKIQPKEPAFSYDRDLVLVLSDWMDEKPMSQLRNLKRGNEWYLIKKGQIQSWNKIIRKGAVGAKLKMIWDRMPDMAISDNYYDQFFINGNALQELPEFEAGERVRVRFVNAAAATYFWLTFGGEDPTLIAADGLNVVPVIKNKTLIAVAETYDFIVTMPADGRLEIRATAQDGYGHASAYLGQGEIVPAPIVPEPDLIENMKQMMAMDMKMGAPASKFRPGQNDSIQMMKKYSMDMEGMQMGSMGEMKMKREGSMNRRNPKTPKPENESMDHDGMNHSKSMDMPAEEGMEMSNKQALAPEVVIGDPMKTASNPQFNYDYLKAPVKTDFSGDRPVREMLFNLTGNMNRYVWSINGVPLSETDKILIEQGEVVRITLNNLTMMHHPMHLHGHFFRVLNEHGEYSPLKHTVNVAPMQKVVIEFDANEYGDWFFHCHVLYHINSGMARIFSYDTPRDERLVGYPLTNLTTEANHLFSWGEVTAASHFTELYATATNIRNQFTIKGEYGWNENLEAEFTYERYLNDFLRVFIGANAENELENSLEEISTTAVAGIRYLLPLLIDADLRIDNQLRPQISLSKSTMLFPRIGLFASYEYQMDFGWINNIPDTENGRSRSYMSETTWQVGLEYVLGRNFALMASYDNRFGAGGGLSFLF